MTKLEECDCTKSCRLPGGIVRQDGSTWPERNCQICSCVVSIDYNIFSNWNWSIAYFFIVWQRGEVTCRPPTCPVLNCTDPNPPDPERGLCCPTCKAECRMLVDKVRVYSHGSTFRPRRCVDCHCDNGKLTCTRTNPNTECPVLHCPSEDQILEDGECCKTCKGEAEIALNRNIYVNEIHIWL